MNEKKWSSQIDELGAVSTYGGCFSGSLAAAATPAQTILPMIEQRIRQQVKPLVYEARLSMERAVVAEFKKMGIDWMMTSYAQFSESAAKQYAEKLVAERIAALVDSLVPPVAKDSVS
jgi:Spy/CpxP family protein refolding chaperone